MVKHEELKAVIARVPAPTAHGIVGDHTAEAIIIAMRDSGILVEDAKAKSVAKGK